MVKVNGHIMSSLMDFVESRRGQLPTGWNVRSRCKPAAEEAIGLLVEELGGLERRVRRQAQQGGVFTPNEVEKGPAWQKLAWRLKKELRQDEEEDGDQVEEEEVRQYCRELRGFVIAPVDKEKGDAAIM